MIKKICALVLACAARVALASDGAPPLIVETLSTREGLPQGTVMATHQDTQGFVWLGTEDGLVRYDGQEVLRYAYSPTAKNGLPGNYVNAIAEDRHGDLWVAVKGAGVARWNRAKDNFSSYRHDPADAGSLSSNAVRALLLDQSGMLWVGTYDAGLNLLDPATGLSRHFRQGPQRGSLSNDQVQTIFQDHQGAIWVGTHSGLDRYDAQSGTFARFELSTEVGKPADEISSITEDSSGNLWIGTFNGGAYRLNALRHPAAAFRHAQFPEGPQSDDVRAVLDDQAGHLWLGTADGLDCLEVATGRWLHFRQDKAEHDSLSDSFIMSLYQDRGGLVWIGTRSGGVNRWNPHSWELGGARPDWLQGKLVTAFAEAGADQVWVGSLGGGLTRLDLHSGQAQPIDAILHRRGALAESRVMSLLRDRQANLWIGTMTHGLQKLTPSGRIESITTLPGGATSLSAAGIMTIFEARNGALWIGTHGGGANILDPRSGAVRQLPFAQGTPGAVSAENVTAFAEDAQGNFWIGTDGGGVDVADNTGRVLAVFKHDVNDPRSVAANTIYSIKVDQKGRVWLATDGGGLDLVEGSSADLAHVHFENISRAQGLSSNTIYGVVADAAGRLWLSGNAGLMRYDPEDRSVKTFHREHGLQGEEFDFGAYFATRDGRIGFGGPGGYNIFSPAALSTHTNAPRIALTHIEILGAPAASATPYWLMNRLELDHRASIVSLDFAVLDFISPAKNRLAYRMRGLSDEWIDLDRQRRITLTNLDAGDHMLEVRAVNADSVASVTPLRMVIHRDPAPYRSAAAYATYALAVLMLAFLAHRSHRDKLRGALQARSRLESEVATRTRELQETNRQLVEASEARNLFLARMSHELRTPMNGVVGMAELLSRTVLSPVQARQTETIHASAKTFLQILNDLLDVSKAHAGKIQLESLSVDITALIEECVMLFSGAAQSKRLDVLVCPPAENDWLLIGDPLRLRQILVNLIGNAVKFTQSGEIVIQCDIVPSVYGHSSVRLSVRDTGIGIQAASLGKIFEPFAQADETTTRRFGGTGLGLSICQELVQLMHGSIEVTSEPGAGSTFTVALSMKHAARRSAHSVSTLAPLRLVTRHRSLGTALLRYAQLLHIQAEIVDPAAAEPTPNDGSWWVIDIDSNPMALERILQNDVPLEHCIVIGSAESIETSSAEARIAPHRVLRKPVFLDGLAAALATQSIDSVARADELHSKMPSPQLRAHVLVVEDDEINAAVAEGFLQQLGCTSTWVSDGNAALTRHALENFDLIFMDLNMPGMDGITATRLIRQREQGMSLTPIVALTANIVSDCREECLAAGMNEVLRKPYRLQEISDVLCKWVKSDARNELCADLLAINLRGISEIQRLDSCGGRPLYPQLVALFSVTAARTLEEIGAALASDDLTSAKAGAHKIKSAAANVGAAAFGESAAALEETCARGNAHEAGLLHRRLSAALPELIDRLSAAQWRRSA